MEAAESKKSKDRSPSFPFITLERALERARQFYDEERRGAAPYSRTVHHWKYTESSSGGLQTVAALKSYGLMDDVGGSGKARQLKLTDLVLRILLDQRPDSTDRAGYLKQAAMSPNVAAEVYARWPEGLPSDSTLNHFLVLERKFNDQTAPTVVKILKQNQELIASTGGTIESAESELKDDSMVETVKTDPPTQRNEPSRKAALPTEMLSADRPVLTLRYRGVAITLQFSEEPSRETFEYLERWAGFEKANALTKAEMDAQQGGVAPAA